MLLLKNYFNNFMVHVKKYKKYEKEAIHSARWSAASSINAVVVV